MISKELISERIQHFHSIVPDGVELVAVSKFQPVEAIRYAYEAGQRIFGESRVQELLEKVDKLPADVKWHFIGHLQTNKVKSLIGKTSLIESVDSLRLLELINKESQKVVIKTEVLLQVHVAEEETKFGFSPEELIDLFAAGLDLEFVVIRGLMAMASNTEDMDRVRRDFNLASSLFKKIKDNYAVDGRFDLLSMGMSGDWPLAVEEGANIIRIGSSIFGPRNY